MEKRVKTFLGTDVRNLDAAINHFLDITKGKLHDVEFIFQEGIDDTYYAAMLIYTEE